jgi:HPt (histidine-containing phosphotransfer) domain-containing protein
MTTENAAPSMAIIVSSHLIQAKVLGMILGKLGYKVELESPLPQEAAAASRARLLFTDAIIGREWLSALKSGGFDGSLIALYDGSEGGLGESRDRGFDDSLVLPVSGSDTKKLLARLFVTKGQGKVFAGNMIVTPEKDRLQVFSVAELDENFMGNMDLVRSLLVRFIDRTAQQIADIPGIAKSGDWETARREAHTIKGSARSMSGMDLGDAAMRWEDACKSKNLDAVFSLGPEMAEALVRFKSSAEQFLAEPPAKET